MNKNICSRQLRNINFMVQTMGIGHCQNTYNFVAFHLNKYLLSFIDFIFVITFLFYSFLLFKRICLIIRDFILLFIILMLRASKLLIQGFSKNVEVSTFYASNNKLLYPINTNIAQFLQFTNEQSMKWKKIPSSQKSSYIKAFVTRLEQQSQIQNLSKLISAYTFKQIAECRNQILISLKIMKHNINTKTRKLTYDNQDKYIFQPFDNILAVYDNRNLFLASMKYAALALISGNNLIQRPPICGLPLAARIQELWREVCPAAQLIHKLPDKQIQITNEHSSVLALITSNRLGFVSYTGRLQQGLNFHYVMYAKSDTFLQSQFLLLSSDTAYVMADLNLVQITKAAIIIARAAFSNAGTNFNSIKRVFVAEECLQAFQIAFLQASQAFNTGNLQKSIRIQTNKQSKENTTELQINNSTLCPIFTNSEYQQALEQLQKINKCSKDFKLLKEGKRQKLTAMKNEINFIGPSIYKITTQSPQMKIQNIELLFPICFIIGVKSTNECIKKINESSMGITSTLFTTKTELSFIEEIGKQLDVGTVNVNTWDLTDGITYSGRKRSGKGFSFAPSSYNNITRTKAISF